MPKPSRLADIAKACGVSTAAVSRILNEDKRFSARPEVRQRVRDTAHQMGYVPDLSARNLNRRSTGIVGMFGSPKAHLSRGVNDRILYGAAKVLHDADFDLFYEVSRYEGGGPPLPFWRFDGAILLQAPHEEAVNELDRRRVPYVCANENIGNAIAAVVSDDTQGMALALEHLYGLGHRTIAYTNVKATYLPHYSTSSRHDVLVEWAGKHDVKLARGHDQPFQSAELFLREVVLPDRATAVITYDHAQAVRLLGVAHTMGIAVPRDLSIVCFNDEFPTDELGLTAIAVSGQGMGQVAAQCLLEAMESPAAATERKVLTVPETLVVRRSSAAPRQ